MPLIDYATACIRVFIIEIREKNLKSATTIRVCDTEIAGPFLI